MRLLALAVICRAAKKPEPASKRLVIISGPRTGSSLLIQMLRAHDQVLMHGEPFHEFDVRGSKKDGFDGGVVIEDSVYEQRHSDPQKLLDAITATATKELVGFKLFRKHVPSHKLGDVLQWATHVIWLCDLGVPRCLHAIGATRVHLTMKWVVSFSVLRPFGPI